MKCNSLHLGFVFVYGSMNFGEKVPTQAQDCLGFAEARRLVLWGYYGQPTN